MRWFFLTLVFVMPHLAAAQARPDPFEIFGNAAELLNGTDEFTVHVEKDFDVVLIDGAMVQYSGAVDVAFSEDRGLYIDYGDDLSAKEFWYDGETVTLLDTLTNIYVTAPFEGAVSRMLDAIENKHGLRLPLAPLVGRNLARDLENTVINARYLGIHDVAGVPCDHLLFRGRTEDWQVWVDAGDAPLIRKLVVNFHAIEGSPQQTVFLTEWDLEPRLTAKAFAANIPDDAIRTEFVPEVVR
jgi:hypothetical protein